MRSGKGVLLCALPQKSTGAGVIVDLSVKFAFDDNLEGITNNNNTLYSNRTGSSDVNLD
jgi:hypothetical protein